MAEYCPIGEYIMELFSAYIDKQNQEVSDKLDYNQRKTFKPVKANQAALAKFLGKTTSNISNKLIGITYVSKDEVLEITDKLQLNGQQFIELARRFALQDNIMVLGPVPSHQNKDVSKKIDAINESFINAITANLLFEIIRKKYSSNLDEHSLYFNKNLSSILDHLKDGISSYDIKEISKLLLK